MSKTDLFSPVRLGDIDLANRVVMAPMTRSRAAAGQVPNPLSVDYYRQRASAGLIITEGAQVSQQGQGYPDTPGIFNEAQVEGWKAVVDAVHAAGGRIALQLWHVGRISHPVFQPGGALPVAPSAIAAKGSVYTHEGMKEYPTPRALETGEIAGIVAQYAHGAAQAKAAGFDGVEIHGANGYLIDQFLRDGTNKRTDQYGGSVENRARFLLEVTAAVVDVFGASRVGVRLSPTNPFNDITDSDPAATFGHAAEQLNRFGLAFLHVIEPVVPGHPMAGPAGAPGVAGLLRRAFTGPYILNGGYDRDSAVQAVESGAADAVAFGIPFISNPDLVRRLQLRAPLAPADRATFYGGDAKGYTDYPALDMAAA
ncbi:alkene reductase [Aerophototrophica crusticola]|uniref:Alkene reductase n=1 Tax=Aerophototrophica crusticola TaxID=1709002 RepID=A0A858RAG6_9PROT|nr:alkene reductase [Rhodospirillaceae bacterium B3]